MIKYPQHVVNVRCKEGFLLRESPDILAAVKETEKQLDGRGRVLLRPSGTELVLRVMVEGENLAQVETLASDLAEVVEESVG